ncbi:MAG TPA: MgtC/SapB family protein [Devosia sp.]|jgi:putative Mg2+ transporter-C (MgtC) family protein|nr:MgtC/SapB family protein [Devosia sp.]
MEDLLHALGMTDTFWPLPTILIRLVVAVLFGAVIGFEREVSLHSAGLRTHILIALAAALYTTLTLEIFHLPEVMTNGRSDPVHSVEAVTAGIAFLGAGVLFRGGNRPRGLTTAAGMWLAGAVGMTAALGYYAIGAFVCALAVVVLLLLKAVERALDRRRPKSSETDAETAGDDDR